ncbi:MAG: NADH-quinone oxidoreductase subunit NuoH [Myxococcales bacterium]|nr:NADH-quinone oxidoreductase subunit NuoH [Myxococcales bacterium]
MSPALLSALLTTAHVAVLLGAVLTAAAYLVWFERKLLARMQLRLGPNRAGWAGLLQPLADVIKLLCKEDVIPAAADRTVYRLAPALTALSAILAFAVIPLGEPVQLFGLEHQLVISDLSVGALFLLGLSSLSVYGVTLGGFASSSKYALLGALRALAQMISYELPLGLSLAPVFLLAGSLSLSDIVRAQADFPFAVLCPVSFVLFVIGALAEARRTPFDLPEAESELVAGYHTEYSGMRFGLYFVGEYLNMLVLGSMGTVFFWGGWLGPGLPGPLWFALKVGLFCFVFVWVRATLPRLRYDQLMRLNWRWLLPLALINLVLTAAGAWLLRGGV